MSHLPGLFISPTQMSTAISTAVSGVPVGELPQQVHLDIAAAVQALPASSTPAQVQAAITTALAGQPVGELPAQVHADIAAAVLVLPVGATLAQVTAAITNATAGLATVAQVNALRVAPVLSTAAPIPATAFSDVTGTSYTMTQIAALVSAILTGGGIYAGTLSLAQPTATRIYQRDTRTGGAFGKGAGVVGLSVTLSAAVVTMDYRLRDADAAGNPVRQDWTALVGAEPAGTVTLSPSVPASASRYLMDVRANGDTAHAVLGTQAFGIGEVVAVAGQSLAVNFLVLGYSPEGTIASVGVTPAANGYEYAPLIALADGNTSNPVAPDPAIWSAPADGAAYSSAFAAEFLRLVTGQAGVVAALIGYAAGGTSINAWQPGQVLNTTLKATLDHAGRFGSLIWIQGHSDSQTGMSAATYQGLLASLFTDLAARYTGPSGTPGGFSRLICSIPSETSNYWGTPAQVNAIRSGALAYVAADPRAVYVAGLDMTCSGDGTHPNQAGRLTMARGFYRAFMGAAGLAPAKPGPSITGATRTAGSAVVKLAITQGAGGTALVGVGTPANQFTIYPASAMFGPLAISSLAIVSPTEIDLTLAAVPADTQALDVWYRLADSDSGAVTGSGIYDNATDGDGLTVGRQLQLVAAAITAAAPTPQAAPAPASGGTTLTFTGAAGTLPTGTATLTPVGTNPPTGMVLNGSGALLLPSQTYAYAQLRGLGILGDGTFEIDAAGGPQPLDIVVLLHASADNATGIAMIFQGEYGHVGVYVPGVANATTLPTPATFTKVRVTSAGTAMTIVVDGATVGTVTITSGATGYVGIGSSSTASPQVAIGQVSFQ